MLDCPKPGLNSGPCRSNSLLLSGQPFSQSEAYFAISSSNFPLQSGKMCI